MPKRIAITGAMVGIVQPATVSSCGSPVKNTMKRAVTAGKMP